jgi:chemosensory pili system protein ChpA (sensor histidine kinase/response regulator)
MMTTATTLTPEMLDSFLAEAWDTVSQLERAGPILRGEDTRRPEALIVVTHRLRGSAGLYGFPELSRLGSLLERVFESTAFFNHEQTGLALEFIALSNACLTESLERIARTGFEGEVGQDLNQYGGPAIMSELVSLDPLAFAKGASQASSRNQMFEAAPVSLATTNLPNLSNEYPNGQALVAQQLSQPAVQPEPEVITTRHEDLEIELRAFHAQDPEMWEYFAPEVQEHLEAISSTIEGLLMASVMGENPAERITQLFRVWHTIKGAAYSVGCQPIGRLAHRLEDALVAVRDGGMPWTQNLASAIIQGADTISLMLATSEGKQTRLEGAVTQMQELLVVVLGGDEVLELASPKPERPAPVQVAQNENASQETNLENANENATFGKADGKAEIDPSKADPESKTEAKASLRVPLEKLENLMDLTGEAVISRGRFERLVRRFDQISFELEDTKKRFERAALDFTERYLNPRLSNLEVNEQAGDSPNPSIGKGRSASEMFSELEFDRYDDLNILARSVGEMANDLGELHTQFTATNADLTRETEGFGKLTRNLRGDVSQMRLVPMGRLFARLKRQARQLSGEKAFELDLIGENVQVDNVVLEGLADPLVHLLTNAVAHGLEGSEARHASGKPREGKIKIRAYQRGNFVYLEVQDDGQGIHVNNVRAKAVSSGLRSQTDVDRMTDEQALELIFLPGLSTKEVVTEQAGRGVGMDAVFAALRRLKGEVNVSSEPGYGTRVTLRVPLTLVVSDVLLFRAGGQVFATPRDAVRALRAVPLDALQTFENQPHVLIGAELIPMVNLEEALRLPITPQGKLANVAVLEVGSEKVAVRVTEFLGLEQTVVKPLDEPLTNLEHLSGATVNSDGEVILVLDPSGLARLALGMDFEGSAGRINAVQQPFEYEAPAAKALPLNVSLRILLVDDSLSVRRVVSQTLKRNGYTVTTAADGQEALDLLSEHSFDAVITDLEMPRLNGFELTEEIRRRKNLSTLPVAMLTSRASDKHAQLAIELGVNEYLTKPLDDAKLEKFLGSVKQDMRQKAMVQA